MRHTQLKTFAFKTVSLIKKINENTNLNERHEILTGFEWK